MFTYLVSQRRLFSLFIQSSSRLLERSSPQATILRLSTRTRIFLHMYTLPSPLVIIQIQEIHAATRFDSICASQPTPTRAIRYSRRSSSARPWWRYTRRGHAYPAPDLIEDIAIRARGTSLERLISRTDTALLFTTKWHVVVRNIVLIDPDLGVLVSFVVRSGMTITSHRPSLQSR